MARTVAPTGVGAVWLTSIAMPTDSSPLARSGRITRAAATSITDTMREVANTRGNRSAGSNVNVEAASVSRTT